MDIFTIINFLAQRYRYIFWSFKEDIVEDRSVGPSWEKQGRMDGPGHTLPYQAQELHCQDGCLVPAAPVHTDSTLQCTRHRPTSCDCPVVGVITPRLETAVGGGDTENACPLSLFPL